MKVDHLSEEQAVSILREMLATPGALRIITAEHRCQPGGGIPRTPNEIAHCADWAAYHSDAERYRDNLLADPAHFVQHAVISIDGPDARGEYIARSAQGDMTIGRAPALLRRLVEGVEAEGNKIEITIAPGPVAAAGVPGDVPPEPAVPAPSRFKMPTWRRR